MFDTRKKVKLVTHDGGFHADDVFATATLLLVLEKENKKAKIIRTRDQNIIEKGGYVYDVGGIYDSETNRFDHHQEGGAGKRDNKIPYSSFGLIWKKFGGDLCGSKKIAEKIDQKLCQPIDAIDNGVMTYENKFEGVYPYILHDIITAFDPIWPEKKNYDDLFLKAVELAKKLLEREIIKAQNVKKAEKIVEKIYQKAKDKRIIVLDDVYPWQNILNKYPEPLFAVVLRQDRWYTKAVRDDMHSFENRKDFPQSWAGKRGDELVQITGVQDALFCHNGRFICVAKTKEGAIKLAQLALL